MIGCLATNESMVVIYLHMSRIIDVKITFYYDIDDDAKIRFRDFVIIAKLFDGLFDGIHTLVAVLYSSLQLNQIKC